MRLYIEHIDKAVGSVTGIGGGGSVTGIGGASPGSRGGPGSKPRGGKYIRRWWEGDHWEYEYAREAGPSTGPQHSFKDEHWLKIPENIDEGLHTAAAEGGSQSKKQALENIYRESRQAHYKPGEEYEIDHPRPHYGKVKIKVVANSKSPTGVKFHIQLQDVPSEERQGLVGLTDAMVSSWAGVERFMKLGTESKVLLDPKTRSPLVAIVPNVGSVDHKNDRIKPSKIDKNRRFKLVIPKSSPLYKEFKGQKLFASTPEDAYRKAKQIRKDYVSAGAAEVPDLSNESVNVVDLLESGNLPKKRREHKTGEAHSRRSRLEKENDLSPEQRDQMIRQLAQEKDKEISGFLQRAGVSVDDPMQAISSPDSPTYQALDAVVRRYMGKEAGDLNNYIRQNIWAYHKYKDETKGPRQKGGEITVRPKKERGRGMVQLESGGLGVGDGDPGPGGRDRPGAVGQSGEVQAVMEQQADYDPEEARLRRMEERKAGEEVSYQQAESFVGAQLEKLKNLGLDEANVNKVRQQIDAQLSEATSGDHALQMVAAFINQLGSLGLTNDEAQHVLRTQKAFEIETDFSKGMKAYIALRMMHEELSLFKAVPEYSHKDGNPSLPRFYYKDEVGNFNRYTNAPKGHDDEVDFMGDAEPLDPSFAEAPEAYTLDGRRLSRIPFEGAPVEWNQSYHPNDPKNLWAGRWVNPVTGAHEYTYVDSDLMSNEKIKIHRQNALLDARLPVLRKFTNFLINSDNVKDAVLGLALALVDQGRLRVRELTSLRVGDVKVGGDLVIFGKRQMHVDSKLLNIINFLISNRELSDPFLFTPFSGKDGSLDYKQPRRIGPHMIINILEYLATPIEAIQTYHASQAYSQEFQTVLNDNQCTPEIADHFATLAVAYEMGHDLDHIDDYEPALHAIRNSMVDPIIINAVMTNAVKHGFAGSNTRVRIPKYKKVYKVDSSLIDKTESEIEFSRWLHTAPVHEYL